jgi:hypothetical protein
VTAIRTVITKRQETMAFVTLEDLQGAVEIVVFPRTYETSRELFRDGEILLVAGRIDHRGGGDDVSLLADLLVAWEDAVAKGPEAFGRDVAAGDRGTGRGGGRRGAGSWNGNGNNGNNNGNGGTGAPRRTGGADGAAGPSRATVAVGPGPSAGGGPSMATPVSGVVSPRRSDADAEAGSAIGRSSAIPPGSMPRIAPTEPVPTYLSTPGVMVAPDDRDDEPAVPDEARARIVAAAMADVPIAAGPDTVLHVRFERAAAPDRLVSAMELVRTLLRERPGVTKVVLHVPQGSGESRPMELRWGVAYDPELVAEVRRRLGEGIVDLRLATA